MGGDACLPEPRNGIELSVLMVHTFYEELKVRIPGTPRMYREELTGFLELCRGIGNVG